MTIHWTATYVDAERSETITYTDELHEGGATFDCHMATQYLGVPTAAEAAWARQAPAV